MRNNIIKMLKLICILFAFIWIYHIIISFHDYYKTLSSMYDGKILFARIAAYWIGIIFSLIIPCGFMFVLWLSYKIKYRGEKVHDNILKKITIFILAISIFKETFGSSIFLVSLFFTLIIFIYGLEKESEIEEIN